MTKDTQIERVAEAIDHTADIDYTGSGYYGITNSAAVAKAAIEAIQPSQYLNTSKGASQYLNTDKAEVEQVAAKYQKWSAAQEEAGFFWDDKSSVIAWQAYKAAIDAMRPEQALMDEMAGALEKQHKWQCDIGPMKMPMGNGKWFEMDMTAEYCDSSMYLETTEALAKYHKAKGE